MIGQIIALLERLLAFFEGTGVVVESRKTLAAAGDYAANDVLSESATDTAGRWWTFYDCARAPGRSFWITGVRVTCDEDSILARVRLHFFRLPPGASELDDNAAFALAAPDDLHYLQHVDLPAFADRGGFSAAGDDSVRKMITPFLTSRHIYMIAELLDAETGETAGMIMRFELEIERL